MSIGVLLCRHRNTFICLYLATAILVCPRGTTRFSCVLRNKGGFWRLLQEIPSAEQNNDAGCHRWKQHSSNSSSATSSTDPADTGGSDTEWNEEDGVHFETG